MKRERLFVMSSPFRDEFRIHGFRFGSGRKSLAVVGAMRGDELQQQFVCSRLVHTLQDLEERGELMPGHEILIIPSANPFAMNIGKRFWAMDNTDINRRRAVRAHSGVQVRRAAGQLLSRRGLHSPRAHDAHRL